MPQVEHGTKHDLAQLERAIKGLHDAQAVLQAPAQQAVIARRHQEARAGEAIGSLHLPFHGRVYNLSVLIAGSMVWGWISLWVLRRMGSVLPRVVMKRLWLA